MTQRTLAGLLALPLLVALWVYAATQPLPFVTYSPGLTRNVLGPDVITVQGHESYEDDGKLLLTTVYVTLPESKLSLFELLPAWASSDDAIVPYANVYPDQETNSSNEEEGQIQMVSSQDAATAVAMRELGYEVPEAAEVFKVAKGSPADGALEPRDIVIKVGGVRVHDYQETAQAIGKVGAGNPVALTIKRRGKPMTVSVTPREVDGKPLIGISIVPSFDFPFYVSVGIGTDIGGPSAGLMFSLGIYDRLTEGSLTDGQTIAGTGEIRASGTVVPIGGIDQKIAGARDAGAQLFLVPVDNCKDALDAPNEDMRLVKVTTMHDALTSVQAWTKDHDAELPACTTASAGSPS